MKISRRQFVKAMAAMSAASMLAACGGNSGSGSSGGKKALTFQIWDVAQKEGMEAMCAAYTQQHPEVSIEVQVTSWNEYWTKLEAAATSNQMPDIFWMHTNELLKYADNGMLADCTDIVEKDKFSEISLSNAMGSNGTLYAVPKDKDTVGLVYNKEMFDAAGVVYPDENWTWDDLVSASEKIYAATGKYGYMAYADDQLGYWNFVYQAGGYILNEDKTKAGFTQPATEKAMKFYIGLQQNDWCPDQTYFAETRHRILLREGRNVPGRRLEHPCRAAELPRNGGQVGCGCSAQVPRPGKRRRPRHHLQRSVLRDCCQQQESGHREGYPEVLRQRGGAAHSGRKRCSHPCLSGSGGYLGRLLCRVSHQHPVLH